MSHSDPSVRALIRAMRAAKSCESHLRRAGDAREALNDAVALRRRLEDWVRAAVG